MICSLEKFLPSPLRTGNSLILIWLKMRRGHFKHWQLATLCFFSGWIFLLSNNCCQNLIHSQNKKMYGADKHQGCKGIVRQWKGWCRPYIFLSWQELKLEIKKCHFNNSGVVPPWQTDAEVDVGTILMFETATIPATGTLFFCNWSCHQNHHLYHQRQLNFPFL